MVLQLKQINKSFGKQKLFDSMNICFDKNGIYLLCGESGSGKTTLLNIIAGYEPFESGERKIDADVKIACIFQNYELIEELNVKDNLWLYQDVFHEKKIEYHDDLLLILGLNDLLDHYPNELSEGQRQRVGIARALFMNPDIILCDEPTESLDIENKERVLNLLKKVAKEKIVIIASHEERLLKEWYTYRYQIINKQLIEMDIQEQGVNINIGKRIQQPNETRVKHYLWKIIRKRTMVCSLILCLLLLSQFMLDQVSTQMFKENDTTSALNNDVIYMDFFKKEEDKLFEKYTDSNRVLQYSMQLPLTAWNYNDKTYNTNIFPFMSNQEGLKIIGDHLLDGASIMINQNVAEKMMENLQCSKEQLIGEELTLTYQIGKDKYPMIFTVSGVVEENAILEKMQLFYDEEYVNATLQRIEYIEGYSHYDVIKEDTTTFALRMNHDVNVKEQFEQWSNHADHFTVYHSVYTHLHTIDNQKEMYLFVFNVIQYILVMITLVYIVTYAILDTKKNIKNLSILISLDLPLKMMKKMYIYQKIKWVLFISVPVVIELLGYQIWYQESKQSILLMIYLIGVISMYFIVLLVVMSKFKKKQVSAILKDSKDM